MAHVMFCAAKWSAKSKIVFCDASEKDKVQVPLGLTDN